MELEEYMKSPHEKPGEKKGKKYFTVPRRALEVVHVWVQPQPCRDPEADGHNESAPCRKGHTTKRAAGAPSLIAVEEQCKDQHLPAVDLKSACI